MWSFDTGTGYYYQTILSCVTHPLRHWYLLFFSDYLILCDTLASTLVPVILLILSYLVWHTSFDTGTGYSSHTILSCVTHQLRHWYRLFFSDYLILYDTLALTLVPVILLILSYLVWHTSFDTGTGYSSHTILSCVTHQLRHWYRLFFSDYLILYDTLASTLVPVILLILSYLVWHTSFDTGTGYSSQTILSCVTH